MGIKNKICYKISYRDQKSDSIVELKVGSIKDSTLGLSFICLSDFIFDTSTVIISPEEEDRKKRFENVKALHLSIYSVLSIAEMGPETPKLAFENDKAKLLILPDNKPLSPSPES